MPGPQELMEMWLRGFARVPVDDWTTFQIQRGEAWRASHYLPAVAEGESLELLLCIGESSPSLVPSIHVGGDALWYAYEDFDCDDKGTQKPAANYKRNAPDGVRADIEVWAVPNITRYGPAFGPVFLPAGDGKGQGIIWSPAWEIVMGTNYEALFQIMNISKEEIGIYVEVSWYHAEHIDMRTGTPSP